ncbi:hypothetical protein [Paenibacillus eucommiae]|uniref:YhfM-like domain-containing protein n=1 Tax=Paenibacillus eucommiae TaxID=1355755 RepID=A0ABS4IYQ6_9BACL|nr:hypothetical protein [Paenibacillus eucommiae]MBP1992723.1 hypothetical protein [Paenibacillus eucommiae]
MPVLLFALLLSSCSRNPDAIQQIDISRNVDFSSTNLQFLGKLTTKKQFATFLSILDSAKKMTGEASWAEPPQYEFTVRYADEKQHAYKFWMKDQSRTFLDMEVGTSTGFIYTEEAKEDLISLMKQAGIIP